MVPGDGLPIEVEERVAGACLAEEDLQRLLQALPVLATAEGRSPELVEQEDVQHTSEHGTHRAERVGEEVAQTVGRVSDEEDPQVQMGGHCFPHLPPSPTLEDASAPRLRDPAPSAGTRTRTYPSGPSGRSTLRQGPSTAPRWPSGDSGRSGRRRPGPAPVGRRGWTESQSRRCSRWPHPVVAWRACPSP
eukprot:13210838-Heterocapsa_arctica.AAC.1